MSSWDANFVVIVTRAAPCVARLFVAMVLNAFNTLRPRQIARHFADDVFNFIFLYENRRVLIQISLKFVPRGPIDNKPVLVQIIACHLTGDKPLSGLSMAQFGDAYMHKPASMG